MRERAQCGGCDCVRSSFLALIKSDRATGNQIAQIGKLEALVYN